jgi:hypothetical protein
LETYALLSELAGTLVLGVAQEFDDAALVGSEADNLLGDLADESGAAGRLANGAADAGLGGVQGGGFLLNMKSVLLFHEGCIAAATGPNLCSCFASVGLQCVIESQAWFAFEVV